jgi:hypothetical protein
MRKYTRFPTGLLLLLATVFVWAGMVAASSFLKAPLKFTAPHSTIPLGVGIGRVVFHALNKVEIGLAAVAGICALLRQQPQSIPWTLGLLYFILALQTAWLLPALDLRATALLAGHTPPPNHLQRLYIGTDVVKLLTLLITGWLASGARRTDALGI